MGEIISESWATSLGIRSAMLPYSVLPLKDGTFIILNRYYKPLGVLSDDHVDYDTHPSRVRIKGLTAKKAASIGLEDVGTPDGHLYLYSDDTNPGNSAANAARYAKIVAKLFKLGVDPI